MRLTTKRELMLWATVIDDYKKRIADMQETIAAQEAYYRKALLHEQGRAEGAINALLLRTNKLTIAGNSNHSPQDLERLLEQSMTIFGDQRDLRKEAEQAKEIERLQQ